MVPHWFRLLSAVFLTFVSTSSFGVHTDYFFKSEAEARAAPVWECGYVDAGLWYSIPGGAMPLEDCMSSAPENALKKVLEQGAAYIAETPPGTRYCLPPPVRDDKCSKWPQPPKPDPVTGLPVNVYALRCYERQTLQCVETFAGGVGIAGGAQMHAGVIGIKGHIDPFKSADVFILVDVPPTPPPPPPPECPVTALPSLPANDVCAQTLENSASTEAQKEAACGTLTPAMQTAVDCFADKLSRTNNLTTGSPIPLVRTSNRRNAAYQTHFNEIWEKMVVLENLMREDPTMRTICAARRAEVAGEKGCDTADACPGRVCNNGVCTGGSPAPTATSRNHCLVSFPPPPGPNGDTHTNGTAIDADREQTVDPLQAALAVRRPPQTIQQFLDAAAPSACGLRWLGPPPNSDPVHFQVPR